MTSKTLGLQDQYAAHSTCFGCGPSNDKGLRIQSVPTAPNAPQSNDEEVVADWKAQSHHEAFPGMVNGGIIGALLDCHSNWTAAYTLMKAQNLQSPPCTVTAEFTVKLMRPTPSAEKLHLVAKASEIKGDRVWIDATLSAGGKVCATCRGLFVAVKEGHPAYHRW